MKNTKTFNKAIKTWFLENEIDHNTLDVYQMRFYKDLFSKAEIAKETEKAILVKCRYHFDEGYWIPKSVLIDEWEEPDKKMINLTYHSYLYNTAYDLCKYETIVHKANLFIRKYEKLNHRDYLYTCKNKDLENCLKEDKIEYLKKADFVKTLRY